MKSTFTVLFCTLLSFSVMGQCPGAFECIDAPIICLTKDLSFTCSNPVDSSVNFPYPNLCFGAGVPHNLGWWSFYGRGGPLNIIFDFNVGNCRDGFGIQAGIFEGKCDGSVVFDCNAFCNSSSFVLAGNTNRGQRYYLWVDGCNGDVCEYELKVLSGGALSNLDRPMPELKPHLFEHLGSNSKKGVFFPGYPGIGLNQLVYEWRVDGQFVDSGINLSEIELDFSTQSSFEVCVVAILGVSRDDYCDIDSVCTVINLEDFDSLGLIEGHVLVEQEINCQYDTSDLPWPKARVVAFDSVRNYVTQTDTNGLYRFILPSGKYRLYAEKVSSGNVDLCTDTFDVILDNSFVSGKNFLAEVDHDCQILQHKVIMPRRTRCEGTPTAYLIYQKLRNLAPFKDTVLLKLDTMVEITLLSYAHEKIDDQNYLVFIDLIAGQNSVGIPFDVRYKCDIPEDLDENICITARLITYNGCNDGLMRDYTDCSTVRNSYDPNDLILLPRGYEVNQFTKRYIENGDQIEFIIRYQNTGNDTAYDIRIEQSFTESFSMEDFQLIESSYNGMVVNLAKDDPRKITFYLSNIYLPDSAVDFEGSQGYIKYALKMDSLEAWTKYTSYADIFFDLNPAVKTNTVFHTVAGFFEVTRKMTVCEGDSIGDFMIVNDTVFFDTVYTEGPDSIIKYDLTISEPQTSLIGRKICKNDTLTFHNDTIYEKGQYFITIENKYGCDSTIRLTVTYWSAIDPDTIMNSEYLCKGDSFVLNGQSYFNGRVIIREKNERGCDSIVHIYEIINVPDSEIRMDTLICPWDKLFIFNQSFDSSGIYSIEDHGCPRILNLNLERGIPVFITIDTTVTRGSIIQSITMLKDTTFTIGISQNGRCEEITYNVTVDLTSTDSELNQFINIYPNPFSEVLNIYVEEEAGDLDYEIYDIDGRILRSNDLGQGRNLIDSRAWSSGIFWLTINTKNGVRVYRIIKG